MNHPTTTQARAARPHHLSALVLVAVAALVLAACGSSTGSGSGTADPAPVIASSGSSGTAGPNGTGAPTGTSMPAVRLAPSQPFTPTPVDWKPCRPDGYECATVEVPLDYDHPTGSMIKLAVKRLPATGPAPKIGSLFFNPGGPGASGVKALPSQVDNFAPDVHAQFDLVSWDPRGVGGSVPLSCDRAGLDFYQKDLSQTHPPPDVDAAAKAWGELCESQNGNLLPFVGTRDIALDLETLRQAVGDDKLNYAGYSYGTLIGLVYAEMFPTRIRSMILDGVVDPTLDMKDSTVNQAAAVEEALNRFIEWCPTAGAQCPITGATGAAIDALFTEAKANPLPGVLQGNTIYLSSTMINFALVVATYNSSAWPDLAKAIAAAQAGDGQPLADLAGDYLGSASPSLLLAVNCLDAPTPTGDAFQEIVDDAAAKAPRTGVYNANSGRPCEYWPTPPKPLPTTYRAAGSPPIMVWGTTGDNATPYANAVHAAAMLENARLVTLEANRHAALGANECVTKIQGDYIVAGTLPPEGTRC